MHNGEIISVSLLFLILPLIATPGGMDVIWAKTVTLINLFLFLIHTYLMYEKGKSNELITNPDDLMKLHPTCNCSPIDPYMRDIGIIHDIIIILGLFYLCWKSCALSADIGIHTYLPHTYYQYILLIYMYYNSVFFSFFSNFSNFLKLFIFIFFYFLYIDI